MATRAAPPPETVDEEGQPVDMIPAGEPLSPIEQEESSLVERIRAAVRGVTSDRLRVKIYRAGGPGAGEQLDEMHPQEFDTLDFHSMRNRWGPGEFEVRVFGDKGIMTRGRMKIAAPIPGAVVPVQQQQSSELAQVVRMLADGQARILEALSKQPAPVDSRAQLKETLELLTMAQALGGQKTAADPMAMFREMMGAAREMKEFQKEIADPAPAEKEDDDSLIGIIKSVSPLIQSALTNQGAQPAPAGFPPLQPMQLPPSIENGAHLSQHAKGSEEMNPQQNPAQLLLLGIIEDLCDMAKAGKSPTEGAEFALDSLPDDALPVLRNRYGVQALALQFPIIKPHEDWFGKVRVEAVRIMDEPEPEADPAG